MEFLFSLPLLFASTVAYAASAVAPYSDFAEMRLIEGVVAPGDYRLEVDDDLWKHSLSAAPLGDVRVVSPRDQAMPWRLEPRPAKTAPQPRAAHVAIDEVDGERQVTLDLGESPSEHDRLQLYASEGTLMMLARVDGSDDGQHWRPLADGAIVYQLDQMKAPNTRLLVRHAPDSERFVRVCLAPIGNQPPTASIIGARTEMIPAGQPPMSTVELAITRVESDPVTRISRVSLEQAHRPGESAVPIESLALEVLGGPFTRRAAVSALVDGEWQPIGSGVLYRPDPSRAFGVLQDAIELPVAPTRATQFRVEIFDAGERPLRLARGFGQRRAQDLVFHAPIAGSYTLYLGSSSAQLPAPLARRTGTIHDAHLGSVEPNPRFGTVTPRQPLHAKRSHRGRLLAIVLAALAIAGIIRWRWRRRRA